MSEIITFMFEPAKLQMNCASASGAISRRIDARDRSSVEGGLTDTDRSVTRLPRCEPIRSEDRSASPRGDEAEGPEPLPKLPANEIEQRLAPILSRCRSSQDHQGPGPSPQRWAQVRASWRRQAPASAFCLSVSNSVAVIAPSSSSFFPLAICSAGSLADATDLT